MKTSKLIFSVSVGTNEENQTIMAKFSVYGDAYNYLCFVSNGFKESTTVYTCQLHKGKKLYDAYTVGGFPIGNDIDGNEVVASLF